MPIREEPFDHGDYEGNDESSFHQSDGIYIIPIEDRSSSTSRSTARDLGNVGYAWGASMKQIYRFAAATLALIASGIYNKANSASFAEVFPIGKIFETELVGPHSKAPLPQGTWEVVGLETNRGVNANEEWGIVFLARIEAGKVTGMISFSGNADLISGSYPLDSQCFRDNMLYRETKEIYPKEQRCSWINHITKMNIPTEKEIAMKAAIENLKARNMQIPDVALSIGFRFSNANKFERLTYYFFPEHEGAPTVADSPWTESDWHVSRYKSDPNKVSYVESLKKILLEYEPKAFAAF